MSDISLRYLLFGEDRTASKAVKGVGTAAHGAATIVGGAFAKMGSTIGGEFGDILDKVGSGLEGIGEHGMTMGQKLQAGGAAVTGLGAALQLVGSKEKQATDQLNAAIVASGHSVSDYGDEIDKTVGRMENFGHGAADTKTALRNLTAATNDPKKALASMGVVANLAAAKHISLADASGLVAKIMGGSGARTLVQYGIHLDKTLPKAEASRLALQQLAEKLSGQAKASVDNFGGRIDVLKTKLGDWVAQMGQKVGPALTAIGPVLMVVGTIMQLVAARNAAAAVAQDAETGATLRQTVAQKIAAVGAKGWAAAQWLLNAALTANPIGLVIVAVAALVAIFVIAWKHSQTFRDIVRAALRDVLAIFQAVWGWIKGNWPYLLGILTGPFGLAAAFIYKHWDAVVGFVKGLGGRIASVTVGMWDGIKNAFRDAIDWIIRGWNSLHFRMPGVDTHIPGVGKIGGFNVGLPQIPLLASGGIATRPTLAMIGESGPEAVIPLSRGRGYAGGITHITINTGPITRDGARELDRSLRQLYLDTGGRLGLAPV